ncbi:MAG: DUF4832 domain-containing protein [Clostridia bacterium]|nr:DUF4832 domain-containing protein [Clostridia bacterium]
MNKAMSICPPEHFGRMRDPERGFYTIIRFIAGDDPEKTVNEAYPDPSDVLILVEINLCRFPEGGISRAGVDSVKGLFEKLRETGRQLIVRFLYDWDGNNLATEPRKIETVLLHISQVAPLVKMYSRMIYTVQGLLIGRWGEMHGSRFLRGDHLKRLYTAFREGAGDDVTVSVRTPGQWRAVTGYFAGEGGYTFEAGKNYPALFNDGIMGSISDLGTYSGTAEDRRKELDFQDGLCRLVPNGGEVISGGGFSGPQEEAQILEKMHISYLNRDHDKKMLDRWRDETGVPGMPEGTDWFGYIERRLGYRFVITDVSVDYSAIRKRIKASVTIKNCGFAPIYLKTWQQLVFVRWDGTKVFAMDGDDLRALCGEEKRLTYTAEIKSDELPAGEYEIYFRIYSEKYDGNILPANEGCTEHGCLVGRFVKL